MPSPYDLIQQAQQKRKDFPAENAHDVIRETRRGESLRRADRWSEILSRVPPEMTPVSPNHPVEAYEASNYSQPQSLPQGQPAQYQPPSPPHPPQAPYVPGPYTQTQYAQAPYTPGVQSGYAQPPAQAPYAPQGAQQEEDFPAAHMLMPQPNPPNLMASAAQGGNRHINVDAINKRHEDALKGAIFRSVTPSMSGETKR
jgi:hypothetical protein